MTNSRRAFVKRLATATGAMVLLPKVVSCSASSTGTTSGSTSGSSAGAESTVQSGVQSAADPLAVPQAKPADWDAIAFNRARGNAGAIPESYLSDVNGPDGELKHLGKHLPYVPNLDSGVAPVAEGMLAIMWGDPSKGHAMHPNAAPTEENPDGHWYDWIRVRKASAEAAEVESRFSGWPAVGDQDNGAYAALEGEDPTADAGKNTVYLVQLPPDVRSGDVIRIHAHCLTHGEYVDFLQVP